MRVPTRNQRRERRAAPTASPPSAQLTDAQRIVFPFERSTRRHAASLLSSTRRRRTAGKKIVNSPSLVTKKRRQRAVCRCFEIGDPVSGGGNVDLASDEGRERDRSRTDKVVLGEGAENAAEEVAEVDRSVDLYRRRVSIFTKRRTGKKTNSMNTVSIKLEIENRVCEFDEKRGQLCASSSLLRPAPSPSSPAPSLAPRWLSSH
jgi:hypothetical protein